MTQDGKGRAVFHKTNVTEWAQLERMFLRAIGEFDTVDIVVPGAGVYEPVRTLSSVYSSVKYCVVTSSSSFVDR